MTDRPPDFDELVGPVDASERDRLRRVHDLLVAAGPPPDLSLELRTPPEAEEAEVPPVMPRRQRATLLALAAALAVAAFGLGVYIAQPTGPSPERVVEMTGAGGATASLEIFAADEAGNWPMELHVDGLGDDADGRPYELWLTKRGKLKALCGAFIADGDGTTNAPMNAPWRLKDFDGWVIVEAGSNEPLLST
jgi:hypothetical protein